MDFLLSSEELREQKVDALLVPVSRLKTGQTWDHVLLSTPVREFLHASEFEGKFQEVFLAPSGISSAPRLLVVGMVDAEPFDVRQFRLLGATIAKACRKHRIASLAISMTDLCPLGQSAKDVVGALVEGLLLGQYRFNQFKGTKSKEEVAKQIDVKSVTFIAANEAGIELKTAIEYAKSVALAACFARDLVNTPAGHMTPAKMAQAAHELADTSSRIRTRVYSEEEMRFMGMEAALSVGQGSTQRPVAIHLRYEPAQPTKRIALVGKAVTFDSGGLSIKPADGMMTMKMDMAGAAAVLGVFKALSEVGAPVAVDGIFIAVENMPSGNAYRPGDVVKAKNGMTIEVLNTDAEGRVTLADALSYAAELKPDVIIDLATLTGAAIIALGDDVAAVLSNQKSLTEALMKASQATQEELWELPLHKPYNELIKSKVADIKNVGGRPGGTITAALFLQPFVNGIPWAHLDIAGPAFVEKEAQPHLSYGGTGFGVRLLMRYLQGLS